MQFTPSNAAILVVGDLILDKYVMGKASRLSPEAPVPVITTNGTIEYRLGGAANVAANISSLGGTPILAGILGMDKDAHEVTNLLVEYGVDNDGVIQTHRRITTGKTRIIANNQQVVRLDSEQTDTLDSDTERVFIDRLRHIFAGRMLEAIVISDYAKGVLSPKVLYEISEFSWQMGVPVFLDPKIKGRSATQFYNAYMVTPNQREAEEWSGVEIVNADSLVKAGNEIWKYSRAQNILVTRGDKGMALLTEKSFLPFRTKAQYVFDVSGAGDTVIAALALAKISGYGLTSSIDIANHAAGVVVGKRGTSICTLEELNLTLNNR